MSPFPVACRSTRFIFVFAGIILIVFVLPFGPVMGGEAQDEQLALGMGLLSTYAEKAPSAKTFFEGVKQQLPAGARSRLDNSNWRNKRAVSSREDLGRKLNDPDTVLLPGGDGRIYAVKQKQLARAINATLEQAVRHPDFDRVYQGALSELPPGIKDKLRESLGAGLVKALEGPEALRKLMKAASYASIFKQKYSFGNMTLQALKKTLGKYKKSLKENLEAGQPIAGIEPPAGKTRAAQAPPEPERKTASEPTTAKADKEQPAAPLYDTARLDTAFDLLNNSIELESVRLRNLSAACQKMGTQDQIDRRINDLLGKGFAPPKDLRDTLRADKSKMVRLDAIRAELAKLSDTGREGADKTCSATAKEAPEPSAVKSSALQATGAAKRAEKLLAEARKLSAELTASLSDNSKIPQVISFDRELSRKKNNMLSGCRKSGYEFRELNRAYLAETSGKTPLAIRSDNARRLLREAVSAGFKHADSYKKRLEKMISAGDAIAAARNKRQRCSDLYVHLGDACSNLSLGLSMKQQKATDEFIRVRGAILQNRSDQLGRVKAAASEIARATVHIYTSAIKVEKCLRIAEQKAQGPSAEIIAEAGKARPSCDMAANAASMVKLGDPRFAKVPGIAERIQELNRVNHALGQEKSASTAAKDHYFDGKPDQAILRLREAKAALDGIRTLVRCKALDDRIARRIDKASRFRNALKEADNIIARCEQPELKKLLRRRGNDTHPVLIEKMARVREQLQLWENFNAAKAALTNNRLEQARRNLRYVMNNTARNSCAGLYRRAQNGSDQIARAQIDKVKVKDAATSCDMGVLKNLQNTYGPVPNLPVAKNIFTFAFEAAKTCKESADKERKAEQREAKEKQMASRAAARDAACRKDPKYGPGYSAGQVDADGYYYCLPSRATADNWCNRNNEGSGWTATKFMSKGGFSCVQSREGRLAARKASREAERKAVNESCHRKYGSGYYAGREDGKGNVYCLPTKAAANRKCNSMNAGSGWRARKIRANGSFDCYQPRATKRKTATRRTTTRRTGRRPGGLVRCSPGMGLGAELMSAADCRELTRSMQDLGRSFSKAGDIFRSNRVITPRFKPLQ
jgi:hypothetical protein